MNDDDDLDGARGIVNAVLYGIAVWMVLYAVYVLVTELM